MHTVKLENEPAIATLVRTVSKKRSAIIATPAPTVRISGTHWDGGSRSVYYVVDIATRRATQLATHAPVQFGGPSTDPVHTLQPGTVVIEAGTFCGKPATPIVYHLPDQQW